MRNEVFALSKRGQTGHPYRGVSVSVRSALGLIVVNKTGQTSDMSNGCYRGVALGGAAANVNVSSGIHEFMLRHTRGRVPRPAGGFLIQTCFGRVAATRKIGNVAQVALFKLVQRLRSEGM